MIKSTELKKFILSIETSCDDTCLALIQTDYVASSVVISSANEQSEYGGVVPELAARKHEENIIKALKQLIKETNVVFEDLDYIAYTYEPGLRVCLNVGETLAHTLAFLYNKPLLKINHLHGHIFSFWDFVSDIQYPIVSLVVSGGHTSIFFVDNIMNIKVINETTDDALGECYDKIARELGLGYPGGPMIDKMYDENCATISFINKDSYNDEPFSFSGLKTAVLNYINSKRMKNEQIDTVSIVSSFQKQAIDIVIEKLKYYVNKYPNAAISIGGGVSANNLLRKRIENEFKDKQIYIPKKELTNDNAIMIAAVASLIS